MIGEIIKMDEWFDVVILYLKKAIHFRMIMKGYAMAGVAKTKNGCFKEIVLLMDLSENEYIKNIIRPV
jgi:hypothetical protein